MSYREENGGTGFIVGSGTCIMAQITTSTACALPHLILSVCLRFFYNKTILWLNVQTSLFVHEEQWGISTCPAHPVFPCPFSAQHIVVAPSVGVALLLVEQLNPRTRISLFLLICSSAARYVGNCDLGDIVGSLDKQCECQRVSSLANRNARPFVMAAPNFDRRPQQVSSQLHAHRYTLLGKCKDLSRVAPAAGE